MEKPVMRKILVLEAATIATALLFGFLFRNFINAPALFPLILTAVGAIVFLAAFLLQTILVPNAKFATAATAISVFSMSLFLIGRGSPVFIVGAVIALALLISAYHSGQSDVKNNLTVRFWKIARLVSAAGTMAIAVFASLAYFSLFNPSDVNASKNALNVIINPLEPVIAGYLPGFTGKSTLLQIASRSLPAEFQLAPVDVKNQAINQVASNLAQAFSRVAGITVRNSDSFLDILYRASFGRLANLSPILQTLVMAAVALVFFFFIKFILFVVNWPAILLGFLVYRLLLASGFFKIELQDIRKESIILS